MILDLITPVLVSEDTIYARERIDHNARLLTQQRPRNSGVASHPLAMMQTPRPNASLFEDRFVGVYPVTEAFQTASVPIPPQPWFLMWKPSNQLADPDPEEQTRRFNHSQYFDYLVNVAGQISVLATFSDIPDLNGPEWQEWVPQPIDHALRLRPFRQYLGAPAVPPLQILFRAAPRLRIEAETDFRVPDYAQAFMPFRAALAGEGPFPPVRLECYDIQIGSLILRWSASKGAAGYRLYINGVPQPPVIKAQTTTVTGLLINTDYRFNIVPVNTKGVDDGAISNSVHYEHSSQQIMVVESLPGTNAGTLN